MDGGETNFGASSACVVRLAIDADFEYYQAWGTVTNVINRVHQVVNAMNPPFEDQLGLTHIIPAVIVRVFEPDPYTSGDGGTLVCQFITQWTNNHQTIARDVAALFTGRMLDGGATIGQAASVLGEICDNDGFCSSPSSDGAYCIAQIDCCGTLACSANLLAHEIGHLWAATHCDPCTTVMQSVMNSCPLTFSRSNINQINTYRNSISCPNCAAPSNDACANARNVFLGSTYAFSTYQATTDGPNEAQSCSSGGSSNINRDVWFRFTASCNAESISVCDATFDTKIALYNGNCPSVSNQVIACNDDSCGPGNLQSRLDFIPVVNGNQYLIRVGGFSASDMGSGVLRLHCAQLHDLCANALTVGSGNHSFNTTTATTGGPGTPAGCGFTNIFNDLWYRYVAACEGIVTFSTCGSNFDTRLGLYTTCSDFIGCDEDFCAPGARIVYGCNPGQVFYVRVGGVAEGFTGSGTLSISCAARNDNCTSASVISAGWHNFSTLGTTTDGPDEPTMCNNAGYSQVGNDIWYEYAASCNGTATVHVCQSNFDTKLAVYSGSICPTTASAIACNDDGCGTGFQSRLTFNAVSGNRYKIRIGGYNGAMGTGVLRITCCPADIVTDQQVGVPDLLAVISAWGPCPALPTQCRADINGDLVVGVPDLLTVIGAWGPCSQ